MKLSDVIKIWDLIHNRDLGALGFCDLDKAIDEVVGVENDINPILPDALNLPINP